MDEFLFLVEMVEQITRDELMVREILSTAKKLFAQQGLKKTTMEDIANAMGKGKSTLYYYFIGKMEIFEAVVEEELKTLLRLTRHAINLVTTAREKLKAYAYTRAAIVQKFHNLSAVTYKDICNNITNILQLKEKHDKIQIELIEEIIKGGVKSGEFKELPEKNIESFSWILFAAFRGIEMLLPASDSPDNNNVNAPDLLIDIVVDGIEAG